MKIDRKILSILEASSAEGCALVLPGDLDRKTYLATNKIIEAIGGKWSRHARAHIFGEPAADILDPILTTGEYTNLRQELGQFDTPMSLAHSIVTHAQISPGMKVYEPSAGVGNLIEAIVSATETSHGIFGHEIDPRRHAACLSRHYKTFGSGGLGLGDFLDVPSNPVFDRVVMNPPFNSQSDIDHIQHAARFLKRGGRLVSVMSASILFRSNSKAVAFRTWLSLIGGRLDPLPDDSFTPSGTKVRTVLVTLNAT